MRLVGATNWFIRLPFLIEGMIEALIGTATAIAALFIMKVAFIDPLRDKIQFVPWVNTPDVISTVIPLILASVLVSAIASMIAMRQFLEV